MPSSLSGLCEGVEGRYGPYLSLLPWDAEWPPDGEQEQEHVLWWSEAQVDALYGSEAYEDAVGLRQQVALACKVHRSLLGASVRRAYRARGAKLWDLWRADDEMTNIRVDIKFKGHDIRTRFIEHGGETHVAVCPVSAD